MVERRLTRGAGQHEGQPGEYEDDVRAEEVGVRVPARGQKQDQVESKPDGGRRPGHQSQQHEQTDSDLDQCHADAGEDGKVQRRRPEQKAARASRGEGVEL